MTTTSKMNRLLRISALFLCAALLLCSGALAAGSGSLRVRVDGPDDVPISGFPLHVCYVADKFGIAAGEFEGIGLKPSELRDTKNNAANAKALYAFALDQSIQGTVAATDSSGTAVFPQLASGIYLVYPGAENQLSFSPFLVYIPTVVNGEETWNVDAAPKAGEDEPPDAPAASPSPAPSETPGPTESPAPAVSPTPGETPVPDITPGPDTPVEGPGSDIPQTGVDMLPIYLLMGFGALFVLTGIVILCRGRSEGKDE